MASMRDIKRRKVSIQSTQQITKAMKLVSTAKLQTAKHLAAESRPFFNQVYTTIASILESTNTINHPFLEKREGDRNAYIVITSNRGLAGGYNSNVCKKVIANEGNTENAYTIAIGRKGRDILKKMGVGLLAEFNGAIEKPTYQDAITIGEEVIKLFLEDKVDNVYIAYTAFVSTLTQEARLLKLLPLESNDFKDIYSKQVLMNYEPSEEEVLDEIIPKYVTNVIFGALRESVASEHGARMTAMDSATNNAGDMIDRLSLLYNRARQAAITQELSEIVAGADAIK
jgi:F-type H+-transporting ATPase subunit gamma